MIEVKRGGMADSSNHYERAFAAWMRSLRILTIPVEETRRTFVKGCPVKSLDFIINPGGNAPLLVDIKGRRRSRGLTLENWATEEDIAGLARWERVFGGGAVGLLTFAYELADDEDLARFEANFSFGDRHYGYLAIALADYRRHMRLRSPKWRTYTLRQADFRALARPMTDWLREAVLAAEREPLMEVRPTATSLRLESDAALLGSTDWLPDDDAPFANAD